MLSTRTQGARAALRMNAGDSLASAHAQAHPSDHQVLYFPSSQSTFVEYEREADPLPVGRSTFERRDTALGPPMSCTETLRCTASKLGQPRAVTPFLPSGSVRHMALYMYVQCEYFVYERRTPPLAYFSCQKIRESCGKLREGSVILNLKDSTGRFRLDITGSGNYFKNCRDFCMFAPTKSPLERSECAVASCKIVYAWHVAEEGWPWRERRSEAGLCWLGQIFLKVCSAGVDDYPLPPEIASATVE